MSLRSNEKPAAASWAQRAGLTPVVAPQRNANQSRKSLSKTSPGSAAPFGCTCPAPWAKARRADASAAGVSVNGSMPSTAWSSAPT